MNPEKAERRPEGTESWEKERTGVTGDELWIVIEFLERKEETSSAEGVADDEDEEDAVAGVVEELGSEGVED